MCSHVALKNVISKNERTFDYFIYSLNPQNLEKWKLCDRYLLNEQRVVDIL